MILLPSEENHLIGEYVLTNKKSTLVSFFFLLNSENTKIVAISLSN